MDTTLQDGLFGQVLDGRYRIDGRIAVGGMATVYRAVDTRLDRVLALKVMHPSLAADGAFVERFIREAKSAALLAHPNVVGVFDQGTDGDYVYLAMEYVSGCTLRDVLRDRGALQPRAALDILEPVLAALGAAHRAGLVHRDMKPENVLIGDDGRVKVADFGLVRAVDSQTSTSTESVLGTVSYLAPEQIEHGTADTRTDLYACGVMLHEMLTGAKPHAGGTPAQVLYQHLHEDVAAPSRSVPGLAAALDGLVARAAARAPEARPQDAVALLSEVRAARATLTEAELDAVPPQARQEPGDAAGTEARTSVIARAAVTPVSMTRQTPLPDAADGDAGPLDRTSRFSLPDSPAGRGRAGGRRGPRRSVLAVLAAVLLALVGTGFWYVNAGQFTRTPAVLDQTQEKATEALRDAGLDVSVTREFSVRTEKGHVIGTDPAPGERIRNTGTVKLTVSRGPNEVKIPDLSGTPLKDAERKLKEAGLEPGVVSRRFDAETAQGSVIATEPGAGTKRRPGTAVALSVSKGAELSVPDVVGSPAAKAKEKLSDAGFTVRFAKERVFSGEAKGAVARQSPGEGSAAAKNDTVTLTLSKGRDMVPVPDVEGKDRDAAVKQLRRAGFKVTTHRIFIGDTVFKQTPGSGGKAPRGSGVTLWLR
ncbi:Stk1 family PASTA domain-containing Ser/Thr kinase [Streptomyces sp. HNM0574]|uniref:Stk1 family PASTA domain-containing Ser/Thr kinase n=1 Tax=Streptomyces sp. HNM0574 TaxID=2714954 RepID=UPI00146B3CE9|nr:Stk1 family PASTA domain-containing Ser/Thr kinase [Streptomyces sp. HNM0574]NLU67654.1 Stk1 family PASTA domain-containing Ser/Thr kinase [Streptomyces sp. HNM0574]